jgi:putative Holliday junction resolvase
MERGVRLGVDVGTVRVGVARSDPAGLMAVPVVTLARDTKGRDLGELAAMVAEHEAVAVVVGLPRRLAGNEGPAAEAARAYARRVARRIAPVPVRLIDERLTTAAADKALRSTGRDARARRAVVDQVAATAILQGALDAERVSGEPAGERVSVVPSGAARDPSAKGPGT